MLYKDFRPHSPAWLSNPHTNFPEEPNFLEHPRPLDATNEPPAFTANPLSLTRAFQGTIYTGQTLGDKATDPDLV
jgi:hypothetical protein